MALTDKDLPTYAQADKALGRRKADPLETFIAIETPTPGENRWRKMFLAAVNCGIERELTRAKRKRR